MMNFAQNVMGKLCGSCIKKFIFGLWCLFFLIVLVPQIILLVLNNTTHHNNTEINENSEFLSNNNSKISTEKVLIENQNGNKQLPDCSELQWHRNRNFEKCEGKLKYCRTKLYGDELDENEDVNLKTNMSQVSKMYCDDILICQSKILLNEEVWCSDYLNDIVNQSTYVEIENSNETMNDIDDTNFICQIVDNRHLILCSCIIISSQVILAPLKWFKNGKDGLWVKHKSQIYKIDDIKVNRTSYNIAIVLIKGEYFKENQIAEICSTNQHLSKCGFTYVKGVEEMLREQVELKSQEQLIIDDPRFKRVLSITTLTGRSKNVNYENSGNPLLMTDENTGRVCVLGIKLRSKKHKKEGELQIFANLSQNEMEYFIQTVITGALLEVN